MLEICVLSLILISLLLFGSGQTEYITVGSGRSTVLSLIDQ